MMTSDINQFDNAFGMFVLFSCVNVLVFFAGMWVQRYKDKNFK